MSEYDPNYVPTYALFLLSVKVIVFNEDGKVLLLKRSDKCSRAHGWDYAGGGVDKGEDPADAAKREVFEETGLTVKDIKILSTSHGFFKDKEYVMIGFAARCTGGDVQLSWEHEEYQWMTVAEIKEIDLPEPHRLIMDAYEQSLRG